MCFLPVFNQEDYCKERSFKGERGIAKKERKTRSQLARDALVQYMQTKKWHDIQRKMAMRARTLGITSEADVERLVHEYRGVKI